MNNSNDPNEINNTDKVYKDDDVIEHALEIVKQTQDRSRANSFQPEPISYNDLTLIIKTISVSKTRTKLLNTIVSNLDYRKNLLIQKLDEVKTIVLNDGISIK